VCIVCAGFFAGIETGLIAADQLLLASSHYREGLSRRAARFLLAKPERLISTTLIGTNSAVVTAGVLLSSTIRTSSCPYLSIPASFLLTVTLLIISEIIPKTFFRKNANTIGIKMAPLLLIFYCIFLPISAVLNVLIKVVLFSTGQLKSSKRQVTSKQDVRLLVQLGSTEAGISTQDQRIIEEIFDFQETMAREVMIQFHETPVCKLEHTNKALIECALRSGLSYVPVCDKRADDLVGYVDITDLFENPNTPFQELIRKASFYPDTKRIPQLLAEMNTNHLSFVFLVNEYGRIAGMLTPEQIVSEIIGFDPSTGEQREDQIVRVGPAKYRISAAVDIEDFQNEVHTRVPRGAYDTIGGYLCDRMGKIPEVGETFREHGILYTITERDDRRIITMDVSILLR